MGIEGLLGDQPPASGSVLSLGSGKVARGNQEKVRLPAESTRHLFSSQQQRRGKCSKQVHKREERAGVFFLPFPFSACPSASVGLVSGIPAPSLLPHTVCLCLSVCLSCIFIFFGFLHLLEFFLCSSFFCLFAFVFVFLQMFANP